MSTRVVERVEEWPDEPFTDGYHQLHDLADAGFSGAVRASGAELYMTKGTVVGIRHGDIDDFEDATGTVLEAPSPALPLLAIMQERSDEVRAKYYTEKTAISEVDATLSDGGFTGYVELSENVLSGDYYLVYHGGHSMSVAYVGNIPELLDGDEAFERADGEVGIYEVRPVEIDTIEIPEPTGPPPSASDDDEQGDETDEAGDEEEVTETEKGDGEGDEQGADGTDSTAEDTGGVTASETSTAEASVTSDPAEGGDGSATESEAPDPDDDAPAGDNSSGRSRDRGRGSDTVRADTARADDHHTDIESSQPSESPAGEHEKPERGRERDAPPERERDGATGQHHPRQGETGSGRSPPTSVTQRSGQASATKRSQTSTTTGLETRAVPSLDPARTRATDDNGARGDSPGSRDTDRTSQSPQRETAEQETSGRQTGAQTGGQSESGDRNPQSSQRRADSEDTGTGETVVEGERIEELESALDEKESEISRLEDELETATGEREDVEAELDAVREERDELAAEVEHLETELERLESEFGIATDAERRMTGSEALDGTDLFVRYHSKGDATLENAHAGSVRKDDVTENLRLEKHTQFDASAVAIGDMAYHEFLENTAEYQFVRWVITDLLFEIRDTNYIAELQNLYDAIPKIDRAELNGAVDVVYSDDGQEARTTERFDVVLRDRMGNPLLVANLNDSREAATQSMMEDLITAAERVGQTSDGFSGAFLVTGSFFEPGALETASEATKGGLLSRDKRKSFVNLSRKNGYHLCLVEARNQNHHLAVPEL